MEQHWSSKRLRGLACAASAAVLSGRAEMESLAIEEARRHSVMASNVTASPAGGGNHGSTGATNYGYCGRANCKSLSTGNRNDWH
jgi:hypothetical protein